MYPGTLRVPIAKRHTECAGYIEELKPNYAANPFPTRR